MWNKLPIKSQVSILLVLVSNLFRTKGISHRTAYDKVRMVHCIYLGDTGYHFQNNNVFLSLGIGFFITNSADPDEMSHLCLHCLPEYPFRGF